MLETTAHLEVNRGDHSKTRIAEERLGDLQEAQVRFRIERFALTANNVTYAVVGEMLGYWKFFPTEEGWGRVPAMGWGEVIASTHPDVPRGGRYYGWFPMSQSIDMTVSLTAEGLRDEGENRAEHAPIYRTYTATDRDPLYEPGADAEDRHALLRGLYLTGFLADDFFADQGYYGATRIIVVSASSKTAIAFAQRAYARGIGEVVGVTSARNVDFVSNLGWYDRVITYDDVETLPTDNDVVSVDMAGNGAVLERVHRHFGERLKHSMSIGLSHHDAATFQPPSVGPTPEMFFAPTQAGKRMKEWGAEGYQRRVKQALHGFIDVSRQWLELKRLSGPEAAEGAWQDIRAGNAGPQLGCIVSLHS